MKVLPIAGLLLIVLGVASLVVPIPHRETKGIKAGGLNIGVQTTHSERVSLATSVTLIGGGIALAFAGKGAPCAGRKLPNCELGIHAARRPFTKLITSTTAATTSSRWIRPPAT